MDRGPGTYPTYQIFPTWPRLGWALAHLETKSWELRTSKVCDKKIKKLSLNLDEDEFRGGGGEGKYKFREAPCSSSKAGAAKQTTKNCKSDLSYSLDKYRQFVCLFLVLFLALFGVMYSISISPSFPPPSRMFFTPTPTPIYTATYTPTTIPIYTATYNPTTITLHTNTGEQNSWRDSCSLIRRLVL